MNKEILINAGAAEIRIAIVEDGRLQELYIERTAALDESGIRRARGGGRSGHMLVGNIVLGRVQRVLPGMQAAFVDIGLDRAGFLGVREARCLAGLPHVDCGGAAEERQPKIGDCVREGEEIVVQVIKDPIGEKGARLSANVTMPGRLLVLVPNQPGVALSRRIEDAEERERLTQLGAQLIAPDPTAPLPGSGCIFRSAAIGAGFADLRDDAERLGEAWRAVMARRQSARAPATLHHDLDPVERTMRDVVDAATTRVLIDDTHALEQARAYCRRAMPEAENLLVGFEGPGTLFDAYGLEEEIARLLLPRIPLSSGGWITIEGTEALTAIDVNSGSYTAAAGLEETSLEVNREAAKEIVRQLRLRGIGGLIIVDFIHMSEAENVQKILDLLAAELARDRTPTEISPMSQFGLVEMTRKRVRDPLFKLMTECCRACHASGRTPTREAVAMEILRSVEREAGAAPGKAIVVRAAPDVVDWIARHDDHLRPALARRGAARVSFEARDEFAREGFDVGSR